MLISFNCQIYAYRCAFFEHAKSVQLFQDYVFGLIIIIVRGKNTLWLYLELDCTTQTYHLSLSEPLGLLVNV